MQPLWFCRNQGIEENGLRGGRICVAHGPMLYLPHALGQDTMVCEMASSIADRQQTGACRKPGQIQPQRQDLSDLLPPTTPYLLPFITTKKNFIP